MPAAASGGRNGTMRCHQAPADGRLRQQRFEAGADVRHVGLRRWMRCGSSRSDFAQKCRVQAGAVIFLPVTFRSEIASPRGAAGY